MQPDLRRQGPWTRKNDVQPRGWIEDGRFRICEPRLTTSIGEVEPRCGTGAQHARGETAHWCKEVDQIAVCFLAGHETMASVLTWAFFILSQQPEMVARLRREVDDVVGEVGCKPSKVLVGSDLGVGLAKALLLVGRQGLAGELDLIYVSPERFAMPEFIAGVKTIVWGGMLTGVAKAIVVVMDDAHIKDTIIFWLSNSLESFPAWMSAQTMLVAQTVLNFFIPSGSGQAAATMPIMAPLADMLGVSRQVACLAFQFGDGLSNLVWPTCGCVIICALGGIPIQKWWRWFLPLAGILFVMQMIFIAFAMVMGL